jgi:peptide-methionine (S)-S-oxide reductase
MEPSSSPSGPRGHAAAAGPGERELLPLDARRPPGEELATATLGLGCFWGPDARFGVAPGVVRTRVGYCGGDTPRPTYESLGRHVEAVQVEHDPARLSFRQVLDLFGAWHDPGRPSPKRQYASAIFWADEEQRRIARGWIASRREAEGDGLATTLEPLERFWLAEAYHQKYRLRHHEPLLDHFRGRYSGRQFLDSTVAARLNGFVAGHGDPDLLESELPLYGLSGGAAAELRDLVAGRG